MLDNNTLITILIRDEIIYRKAMKLKEKLQSFQVDDECMEHINKIMEGLEPSIRLLEHLDDDDEDAQTDVTEVETDSKGITEA